MSGSQTYEKRGTQSCKEAEEQAHCYSTLGQSPIHREVCKSVVRRQEERVGEGKVSVKVSGSLGTITKSWKGECICSEWTRVVKDRVSESTRAGSAKAARSREPGTPEQPQAVPRSCRLCAGDQGRQAGRQALHYDGLYAMESLCFIQSTHIYVPFNINPNRVT